MYYLVKANLKRGINAKIKKETFVVKSEDIILAESITMKELSTIDPNVKISDINLKNYIEVFLTEDNTGPYFDIVVEFDDVDGKIIKENYLQQSYSTKEAEEALKNKISEGEVKSIKETSYVDYLETNGEE